MSSAAGTLRAPDGMALAVLAADVAADDAPLRHDIRLLGRILGDVIREQAGARVFELVEGHAAARRRRAPGAARGTAELSARLERLSDEDALGVIRASSLFSLLANIAEDVHQSAERRCAGAADGPGTLRGAVERLHAAGLGRRRGRGLVGDLHA